jgi:hypothetical protein
MSYTLHILNSILAQGPVVGPPDSTFPGGAILLKLLAYARYIVLALAIGSVFYGGGSWAWSKNGNAAAAGNGRTWVVGGIIGALLAGVGPTIINELFTSASA